MKSFFSLFFKGHSVKYFILNIVQGVHMLLESDVTSRHEHEGKTCCQVEENVSDLMTDFLFCVRKPK